jgi:FlaA1/EpsC-like NDP-sugar epimerase
MISISGASGIDIVFSGLRPGEKLHEVLFSEDESVAPTGHPLIRSVSVPPIDPAELRDLAWKASDQ